MSEEKHMEEWQSIVESKEDACHKVRVAQASKLCLRSRNEVLVDAVLDFADDFK